MAGLLPFWGESWLGFVNLTVPEGGLKDILEIRQDIAKEISAKLRSELTAEETMQLARTYTNDDQAHAAYLKGRFQEVKRTTASYHKAIQHFEEALSRDPNYARAYAALSRCYRTLAAPLYALPPEEAMPKAEQMAMKALGLDDQLAEAHAALAWVRMNYDWNSGEAEREFKKAIELDSEFIRRPLRVCSSDVGVGSA